MISALTVWMVFPVAAGFAFARSGISSGLQSAFLALADGAALLILALAVGIAARFPGGGSGPITGDSHVWINPAGPVATQGGFALLLAVPLVLIGGGLPWRRSAVVLVIFVLAHVGTGPFTLPRLVGRLSGGTMDGLGTGLIGSRLRQLAFFGVAPGLVAAASAGLSRLRRR